jgi:hypothetical protein
MGEKEQVGFPTTRLKNFTSECKHWQYLCESGGESQTSERKTDWLANTYKSRALREIYKFARACERERRNLAERERERAHAAVRVCVVWYSAI